MSLDQLRSSLALLANPFLSEEPAADKFFLLASVTEDDAGRVVVTVTNRTPVVALNDKLRRDYGLRNYIPTVVEMQKKYKTSLDRLISGGIYFWLCAPTKPPEVLLLQRDAESTAAGEWTEPAGRCDRRPDIAIGNEGHEELLILFRPVGTDHYCPIAISGTNYEGAPSLAFKYKQIKAKLPQISERGIQPKDIDFSRAHLVQYREMPQEKGLYRDVVVSVNGEEQTQFRAMCLFDPDHNTLELRRSIAIEMHARDSAIAIDGEQFNRTVQAFTLDHILKLQTAGNFKARPALASYIRALTSNTSRDQFM
jgi:hypothetical protein